MKLIKIIRSSIKENINAGNTTTLLPGRTEITCTYQGDFHYSICEDLVIESEEYDKEGNLLLTEFRFIGNPEKSEILKELSKDPKCSINIDRDMQMLQHMPEPKYHYKYENPLIKCDECNKKVRLSEIIMEYDEGVYHQCPNCKEINTFAYKHEDINDVIIQ
jgi:phage FluMu protein Com